MGPPADTVVDEDMEVEIVAPVEDAQLAEGENADEPVTERAQADEPDDLVIHPSNKAMPFLKRMADWLTGQSFSNRS